MPSPVPDLRDVAPPVEVFPYPLWMVISAGVIATAVLVLFAWAVLRWWKKRPAKPPPAPRDIAIQRLADARNRLAQVDPYTFSILVSDILRSYVTSQFNLCATQQTSPEFLSSAAQSSKFSTEQKSLLQQFLEKCDLIKFARADATANDNAQLLEQATLFVEGKHA
jgi:Domain of unknown function (DUF4381)